MRVFVTGATGFIGSAIVRDLIAAQHQVVGLARSEASAAALAAAGAGVQRGTLEDLDGLRSGAAAADGVIHAAFMNEAVRNGPAAFAAAAQAEWRAIEAMGAALAGSGRPLVMASGTAGLTPGRVGRETDEKPAGSPVPRSASERGALRMAEQGVRVSAVRLPPTVHGAGDHGFVPTFITLARAKGVSAYPGDGANRWPAVHRLDAANLFRLALERGPAGSVWHAVADEGVPVVDIASAIGRRLNVPVVALPAQDAVAHFGFLGNLFALDIPASSALTRERLGWQPVQPALLADLEEAHYFRSEK